MNRRRFVSSLGASALLAGSAGAEGWMMAAGASQPPADRRPEEQAGLMGPIAPLPAPVGVHELCEFSVPVRGEQFRNLNPFRQSELALDAEFTCPSGKRFRVPGFYLGTYGPGAPAVISETGWRVRFSGSETGKYQGRAELRIHGKVTASCDLPAFVLTGSQHPGMIRFSKDASRYLEHDDGKSYLPVGQDVCWTTDVSKSIPGARLSAPTLPWDQAYTRRFTRMGENGANWARVFMKPAFYLESGEPWCWDNGHAARLDRLLEIAKEHGIFICLCFNPERSDEGTCYKGSMDIFRAADTAWGRLLASQQLGFEQFFRNPLCREMYRDKIRYIVGRWGFSPNIFGWEFWNEIEAVDPNQGIYAWNREMTGYLRSVDSWHHLIKSSAHQVWSPEFWGQDSGDLNDVHPYFGWSGDEGPKNFGAFLPEFSSGVYATGRPFIVGETGIAREVTTKYGLAGDLADKDVSCFHVHEALWGGLFSGSVGSGMVWWWDEHVDLHDGYFRFRNFANFIADIEFNHEGFTRGVQADSSSDELRLFELIGRHTRLVWIRHRDLSWYAVAVEKKIFKPIGDANVTLNGISERSYVVDFWSSEEGKLVESTQIEANGSILMVPLPEIRTELALKIKPVELKPMHA